MRLCQQPKFQKTLDNYLSNLKPEVIKFINSKRMLSLCRKVVKQNPSSNIQDIIIHDILIERYNIYLTAQIIRHFLENKRINYNKRIHERKRKNRKIRTDENVLSIKY